jgi:hypothetical protein
VGASERELEADIWQHLPMANKGMDNALAMLLEQERQRRIVSKRFAGHL